ncbi:hypothetical protein ACWD3J_10535 [Streptomyces sp. NPDC002755]|uniref:hypothetical protein n=1 Tax=Streptomyces sp. NPDC002884 TaxID=3154544 RepID=UPI00331D77A5
MTREADRPGRLRRPDNRTTGDDGHDNDHDHDHEHDSDRDSHHEHEHDHKRTSLFLQAAPPTSPPR